LQQTEGARLVRADAVLHARDRLALEPHHQHRGDETDDEDHEHLHEDDEEWCPQEIALEKRIDGQE
jgi:hypothetical protein